MSMRKACVLSTSYLNLMESSSLDLSVQFSWTPAYDTEGLYDTKKCLEKSLDNFQNSRQHSSILSFIQYNLYGKGFIKKVILCLKNHFRVKIIFYKLFVGINCTKQRKMRQWTVYIIFKHDTFSKSLEKETDGKPKESRC